MNNSNKLYFVFVHSLPEEHIDFSVRGQKANENKISGAVFDVFDEEGHVRKVLDDLHDLWHLDAIKLIDEASKEENEELEVSLSVILKAMQQYPESSSVQLRGLEALVKVDLLEEPNREHTPQYPTIRWVSMQASMNMAQSPSSAEFPTYSATGHGLCCSTNTEQVARIYRGRRD